MANVCALSFSSNTELVPCTMEMISLASRSSSVCPGRLSHALRIHFSAYRVRCFSLSAMGRAMILPPWVCDMVRTAGAASRTASRTISSGGARVRECTQRSMRETVRDARLRFPWRMMVFVMNWRRGSSTGGMSRTGGGAWALKVGRTAEEGGVDGTVVVVR